MSSPRIYTRKEWGARYRNGFGARTLPAATGFLHHAVMSPGSGTWAGDVAKIRTLENVGHSRFGGGISYNYLICESGRIFEGVGVSRIGSHTGGHNTRGIGICLVGSYMTKQPTAKQLASLLALRGWLVSSGKLTNHALVPHRKVKATACPGDATYALMGDINLYRRVMKRGMRGNDVQRLQQRLVAHRFASWKAPRGIFGLGTHRAATAAKIKFFGSTRNSNVGPKTYARLIRRP